eukprot:1965669-Rhodomonas_salina.2
MLSQYRAATRSIRYLSTAMRLEAYAISYRAAPRERVGAYLGARGEGGELPPPLGESERGGSEGGREGRERGREKEEGEREERGGESERGKEVAGKKEGRGGEGKEEREEESESESERREGRKGGQGGRKCRVRGRGGEGGGGEERK